MLKCLRITSDNVEEVEIENELSILQYQVDGYIEVYPVFDNYVIICNEEGKLRDLDPTLIIKQNGKVIDLIRGNCLLCKVNEEEFESLSEEDIRKFIKEYSIDFHIINL